MKDKNCVVTGGNSGIGYETALSLANLGANVIIVSRSADNAEQAVKSIKAKSQNNNVDFVLADLSSQKSIRDACKYILREFPTVDVLVNNAGTWVSNQEFTEEKIERQFAVNHLAYFLMTHELLPGLTKSSEGRIICVGSDSHFKAKINFDDFSLGKKYHGLRAYAQSKLANVMFTYAFNRKCKEKGINNLSIYCVQPGLVKTDIGMKHTISLHGFAWRIRRLGGVTPAEGAKTSIYLASSEDVEGQSGLYWDKCKSKKSSKESYDQEKADRLWDKSKELCGISDYFSPLAKVSHL